LCEGEASASERGRFIWGKWRVRERKGEWREARRRKGVRGSNENEKGRRVRRKGKK
jgi:hypothetical protein